MTESVDKPFPSFIPSDARLESMLRRRKLLKVVWHLTNRCNLACTYCYVKVNRFPVNLSTDSMLRIADQINAAEAGSVQLTGGEALLRPDILTILDRLSPGINVSVNTNGVLLSPKLMEAFRARSTFVSISLDHYDPVINALTRRGSPTSELVSNLRQLADAGIETGVTTVVTRYNYRDLTGIAEFLRRLGVNSWKAVTVSRIGEAADPAVYGGLALTSEQASQALHMVYDLRQSYHSTDFEVKADVSPYPAYYELFGSEENQSTSCFCGYVKATIKHDGGVVPCDSIEYPGDYLRSGIQPPSLLTDGNLSEIFRESPLFRYWAVATAGVVPIGCNNCQFFQQCRGFCRGRSLAVAGRISGLFGPAPECARTVLHHPSTRPESPKGVMPVCTARTTAT